MRNFSITVLLALSVLTANAQIKSGSFSIDGDLNQINVAASADFGKFRADMNASYNISEEKINYYHAELSMAPADIYFALEISRVSHQPMDEVIRVYKAKKANGWGEIAKELGIKPGSPEFHALKNNASRKSAKYKGNPKSKTPKGKGQGNGKNSKKQKI